MEAKIRINNSIASINKDMTTHFATVIIFSMLVILSVLI